MKKSFSTIVFMLFAIALNAQVSVWDGTIEHWDESHAGTENDPYLIENAAQLAYMSTLVYTGQDEKYWKLTTDIDLDNKVWDPIGSKYADVITNFFLGYFDGDNHTIYHLSNSLFFVTEGYVKNITVKDSEMIKQNISYKSGFIAYSGDLIENCHNYGNITINGIDYYKQVFLGGVVGECTEVRNCSNYGTITVNAENSGSLYVGGVAGKANNITMSYNTGEIYADINGSCNYRAGGVCGILCNSSTYCYNIANIVLGGENSYAGGIAGDITEYETQLNDNININYCYNAGDISSSNIGGVLAKTDYDNVVINAENSYYINTIESINNYGTPQSESFMKSQEFVSLLNDGGNVYAMDDLGYNHGYPIFAQYYSVGENENNQEITFYPNPATDCIHIIGDVVSYEMYDMAGKRVKSVWKNMEEIRVTNLQSGIYIIRFFTKNDNVVTKKIIKN